MFDKTISPSRTYVVICKKSMTNGYKPRKFTLPGKLPDGMPNDSDTATWWYMNRIDFESVVVGSITFEDYKDLQEVKFDNLSVSIFDDGLLK